MQRKTAMKDKRNDLLVIIPAFNEEENICQVVTNLIEKYPQYDYVIINDGSMDRTSEIAHSLGYEIIDLPINLGLAGAFQTGMRYADQKKYKYAIQLDADGQHLPEYIAPMFEKIQEGYDLVIGSEDFQPEFEEHLIGAKAGDTLEFTITLSDDYDGDYAGKDADFKVTVNAVQEINVPELNDNYCKKYTDYDTVDEYRAGVRKELEEYYDETNTETAQNDLLSQILADMFGTDVSDIAGSEDDVKSAVEEMVYTEMLTTAIAEKENIAVSDDEYTDYVNSVYEDSGYTSAEEYEEDYTKDETLNTILYNKVMDFLMQNATVTEVSEDEYYEEDTEMDEEAYDTEEITENETDAEDLEMTE